jgi:hypothetical protein
MVEQMRKTPGTLLFSANTTFAACDPSCFACSGMTAADCTSCFSGFYLGSEPLRVLAARRPRFGYRA